ncbi:hypothetical protein HPP92_017270 [Vanilla planifolia]|uniref:Uncharacterized protein n=1 Tax=Vanilla planifolia TaxID=51239 RepID=A0A835QF33_VANPL|nr:hypothetical protein HPP92_017270 [Vanilla planifolia]
MAWELLLWIVAFLGIIALVAVDAYQLICLSDLESDYINPYDCSARINGVVIPEFILQGILSGLFLLTWQLIPFLLMAPITYFHLQTFLKRKHLMDVTEIFRQIDGQKEIQGG